MHTESELVNREGGTLRENCCDRFVWFQVFTLSAVDNVLRGIVLCASFQRYFTHLHIRRYVFTIRA